MAPQPRRILAAVRAATFVGMLLWLWAAQVRGEDSDSGGSPEYHEYVRLALNEFRIGHYDEARAFFVRAHALSANARTMRGIGMCAFEMRNYVDAIDWFERALKSTERPLTDAMRMDVQRLLDQARTFVTHFRVLVQPSSAKLRIDGRPVELDASSAVDVDPGSHELVVEAADYDTATRRIRTAASESLTLSIALSPQKKEEPPALTRVEAAAPPPQIHHSEPATTTSTSVGPWILIGTSAAVATAGAVFLALALSNKSAVEHPDGAQPRYDRSADEKVLPYSATGLAGLAVGAAGIAGGVLWLVWNDDSEASSAQLDLGPSGVRVRGTF